MRCLLAAGKLDHRKLRQAVLAFYQHVKIFKDLNVIEHHIRPDGNDLFPVFFSRRAHWRRNQTEGAAFVIGADQELVAVMVGIVLHVLLAWRNQLPLAVRIVPHQDSALLRWCGCRSAA